MKPLLAALALLACPASAADLPQGSFLLGTYIWNEAVLPRSVLLTFEGAEMRLAFVHPLPLDFEACDTEGICDTSVEVLTASAVIDEGRLVLDDIELDEDAAIEPTVAEHVGLPQDWLYTNYAFGFLQMAEFTETANGFQVGQEDARVDFYRVAPEDVLSIIALPVVFEQSIAQMAGCEVRALAPLLAKPDPTPAEARFAAVVRGFGTSLDFDFQARRLTPFKGTPSEADELAAAKLRAAAWMPGRIAGLFRTPEEGGVEEFRQGIGLKMFRDDAEALDAAIAAYGAALPDMVAYFRHVPTVAERLDVEGLCADPSLGFIAR